MATRRWMKIGSGIVMGIVILMAFFISVDVKGGELGPGNEPAISIIEYTYYSKTICNSKTCSLDYYPVPVFAYEDKIWKGIEDTKSLMKHPKYHVVYLKNHSLYPLDAIDFNTTSINVRIIKASLTNIDIPIKIWKRNLTGIGLHHNDSYSVVDQYNISFSALDTSKTNTFEFCIGCILDYGFNSTKLLIVSNNTLDDTRGINGSVFLNTNFGDGVWMSAHWDNRVNYEIGRSFINPGFVCDQIPGGATIDSAEMDLKIGADVGTNNLTVRRMLKGWDEMTLTAAINSTGNNWDTQLAEKDVEFDWSNPPLDGVSNPIVARHNFTITDYLQNVCDGVYGRQGLLIMNDLAESLGKPASENTILIATSDSADVPVFHITYTEAAADSCTYSGSGNHTYQCSDNCTEGTVDHLDNNVLINGTGTFKGNLTNYADLTVESLGSCLAWVSF